MIKIGFNNIFDAHAHYDDEKFDLDRFEVLSSLPKKGVCAAVNNAVDLQSAEKSIEYAEKFDFMYAAAGFHPEALENMPENYIDLLKGLCAHEKVRAIGEIGLDYHWETTPRKRQKEVFVEQIRLAIDLDMPVVVHDREAHGDTMEILKKYRPKALVHCFSGSVEMMREVTGMGMYLSLGGAVTFNNARRAAEVAARAPIDRLLLETDAPYMTPVPFRGKRCDSSHIIYTAQKIAELRNMSVQSLLDITAENARRFYEIGEVDYD